MSVLRRLACSRPARVLSATALLTVLLAVACNAILDLLQLQLDYRRFLAETLAQKTWLFLFGSLVVWLIVVLTLAVVGRLWLTVGLVSASTLLLGFANYKKIAVRQEPLYPSDAAMLASPQFLEQMVGTGTVVFLGAAMLAVVVASLLLGRVLAGPFPRISKARWPRAARGVTALRLVAAVLSLLALAYIGQFNATGNQARRAYEANGADWKFWFQKLNYDENGFVGGILYNLDVPAMNQPPGYSRRRMARIVAEYQAVADRINRRRTTPVGDVNVVLALGEAFSDPTKLRGLRVAEDPIPRTRRLLGKVTSGQMLAQLYGGGTANMEFEALTGMSLSSFLPQMNTPYQMLVPQYRTFPSVVGYLQQRGHRAVAVHPYMTSMYKRERVYDVLGFDDFVYDETMRSPRKLENNPFISDRAAFDEVLYQLRSSRRPLLVNLVTMQNHYPWQRPYRNPIAVSGPPGDWKRQTGQYLRGLEYTDRALAKFLGALDAFGEKTVVVFYGDHQPALYPPSVLRKNRWRARYQTPMFVYTNFPSPSRSLPTTSPIFFMNLAFQQAGVPIPPYYALLEQLRGQVSAMEGRTMIDARGRRVAASQLTPEATDLLRDYRLVQYDLSVGERYSQAGLFYRPLPGVAEQTLAR